MSLNAPEIIKDQYESQMKAASKNDENEADNQLKEKETKEKINHNISKSIDEKNEQDSVIKDTEEKNIKVITNNSKILDKTISHLQIGLYLLIKLWQNIQPNDFYPFEFNTNLHTFYVNAFSIIKVSTLFLLLGVAYYLTRNLMKYISKNFGKLIIVKNLQHLSI